MSVLDASTGARSGSSSRRCPRPTARWRWPGGPCSCCAACCRPCSPSRWACWSARCSAATSSTAPLALVGVVFVLLQVLTPIHQAVSANLGDRTAAWLYDRLTEACVGPPGMGHLEDPELTSDLTVARDFDLGMTGPPLSHLDGLHRRRPGRDDRRARGGRSCSSAYRVVGAARARRRLARHALAAARERASGATATPTRCAPRSATPTTPTGSPSIRRPAKELRLFGLAGWTIERFVARRTRLHELQYEATRLRERPVLWSLLLVVGANVRRVLVARRRRGRRPHRPRRASCVYAQCAVGTSHDRVRRAQLGARRRRGAGGRGAAARGRRWRAAGRAARPGTRPAERRCRRARSASATSRSRIPGGAAPVLDGFDLTIPAGSSLAIVGQNGAGKTTLAKLLCRLYDPQAGAIEVDGVDLRELRPRRLAVAHHGRVPGLHPLRAAAARQRRARRRARRRRAARRWTRPAPRTSPALDTVLARGYEGGTDLSGGQWQRVALARALCAVRLGAGVVLLDEPTAQLDVRGEAEIFERILAATRHCTTILISHRFSTVRHADRICVLEHGTRRRARHARRADGAGRPLPHDVRPAGAALRRRARTRRERAMTSSPERPSTRRLPPALPSMWRLLQARLQPRAAADAGAFALSLLAALPDALLALLVQAARRGRDRRATGARAHGRCSALGVSAAATWFLQTVSTRVQRRFRDKVTIALESHVATAAGVDRDDRAPGASRVSRPAGGAARSGVRARPHVHVAVLDVRLDPAARRHDRAARVDSPGAVLLAVFALPTVLTSTWRPAVERSAQERGAPASRLARHLFDVATTAAARQGGARHAASAIAWSASAAPRGSAGTARSRRARWASAAWHTRGLGGLRRRATSARSCSSSSGLRRTGGRRAAGAGGRARGCRSTSAPPSARSASCAASGWTARGGSRGSRTTRPSLGAHGRPAGARRGSTRGHPVRARLVRVSRAPSASCSTTSRSSCRPARSSRSSARTAPARPRSSSCSPRCTSRRSGRISSIGRRRWRASPRPSWRERLAGAFQDFFRFEFTRAAHRRRRRRAAARRRARRADAPSSGPARTT